MELGSHECIFVVEFVGPHVSIKSCKMGINDAIHPNESKEITMHCCNIYRMELLNVKHKILTELGWQAVIDYLGLSMPLNSEC